MKRIRALILIFVMLLSLLPQMTIAEATATQEHSWDVDGDGALEILAIGNSFSVDAMEYVYQIAESLGIEQIVLGNLYVASCSIETHITNATGDLAKYTYYYNNNGTWSSTLGYKISTALSGESWDYIWLQQQSANSGFEATFNEDLADLVTYVQKRSFAKLVWHMTWAYQQNYSNSSFTNYNADQMTMYNSIVSTVQSKILTNDAFSVIIPSGTAIQNSRTSLLGDTTTRDGYHISKPYGRYLLGLMTVKSITGIDISNITYAPSGVSEVEKLIAVESVNNAYSTPYAVTKSVYMENGAYILQDLGWTALGYWNNADPISYNKIITGASISSKYYATIRFTKEELPVGSVIVLASGWQYRPNGWVTDTAQSHRENLTTTKYVLVTEEWWGDYTMQAFNISKLDSSSLSNVTEEEIFNAFKIYVPVFAHIHTYTATTNKPSCTQQGYTTYTCVCGNSYVNDYTDTTQHSLENGICTVCGNENDLSAVETDTDNSYSETEAVVSANDMPSSEDYAALLNTTSTNRGGALTGILSNESQDNNPLWNIYKELNRIVDKFSNLLQQLLEMWNLSN